VAAGTTLVFTPLIRFVAIRFGAVDLPNDRRVHERPTPTLGGIAMYVGLLAGFGVASRLEQFDEMFTGRSEPIGILLAATIILAVGVIDDLREVSAPAKAAGQVLAGSVLSLFGVTMLFFRVPFGEIWSVPRDLAPLITVIWVMGMTNAVNLIDGLDGLSAGIVAIAAGAFFLYTDTLFDQNLLPLGSIAPLLAIITAGICLGFLPHNFHPAKIFMGDGGALFLGLLMACSTLLVGGQTAESSSGSTFFFFAPLFIPFFILGVPILDTAFSIVRRASKRTGVAIADKDHLHHRLMRLGHGQRRSVAILWAWTALLSGFVLYPAYTDTGNAVVPFGVAALGVMLYTVLHPEARRTRAGAVSARRVQAGAAGTGNGGRPAGSSPAVPGARSGEATRRAVAAEDPAE
jgi:UDP-GlcNAc:undecaprenyl-phosphate GlcNAc-1-phosphate transferase